MNPIYDLWAECLSWAYVVARGERAAEIRGDRRAKRFDGRGLHPYSVAWGYVLACESFAPELAELRDLGGDVACEPVTLRAAAHREAEEGFEYEVRTGAPAWA